MGGFANPYTAETMLKQVVKAMETGNPSNIEAYIHRLYLAKRSHDFWFSKWIRIEMLLGKRDAAGRLKR